MAGSDHDVTDHRLLFDAAASEYELGRPGYPVELFELLAQRCGLTDGARVLEIGPGPGQATAELIARGARVTAVEPGTHFARRLSERFDLEVVNDFFEQVDLSDDEFDLAISATAFHWVEQEVGLPKIARSLRPGGWVVLTWNRYYDDNDPVEFTAASKPIMDHHLPDYRGSLGDAEVPEWNERLADAGFVEVEEVRMPWRRTETTDEVVARFLTHSGPLALDDAGRRALETDLRRLCDDRFGGVISQACVTLSHLGRKPISLAR